MTEAVSLMDDYRNSWRFCFEMKLLFLIMHISVAVGTLRWVQEPTNPTQVVLGATVVLRWDYNIGDPSLKFLQVEWTQTIASNVNDVARRLLNNNPEVFNDFKARFNIIDKATLIINSVNITDEGTYRCKVSLQSGSPISSAVELNVLVPPQIILSPQNQTVNESNYAMMRCLASGKPEPTYKWTRDGADVSSGANLTFKEVKRSDDGLYTCTADIVDRKDLAVNAHASLIVQYLDKPNIEPQPKPGIEYVTFTINGSLALRCTGNGNPPPQLSWIDNKGNPTNGPILRKENAGENDNGIYKCIAANRIGTKEVSVTVKAVAGSVKVHLYKIELELTSVKWDESLAQKNSEEFKNLSSRLISVLEILYQNQKIAILKFSSGSVKVLFQVSFEKLVDHSEALAPLLEAAKKGPLGDGLEVDPDSIKLAPGSAHRADPCEPNPCVHGLCEKLDNAFKCSCDSVWRGDKCDDSTIIIVIAVVISVVVVVLVFLICFWHKRNRKCRKDFRAKGPSLNAQDTTLATPAPDYAIPLEENSQMHKSGHYADLNKATRSYDSPSTDTVQPTSAVYSQPSAYASLDSATRSWEVNRGNVKIEKMIGKGAFGQVAKATATDLPGRPGQTIVAVKMLKENPAVSEEKDLMSELELMKKMKQHPHVIKLLGCVTKSEPMMVLIEYVPYGDLLGYLRTSRGLSDIYYKDPDVKPRTNLTSRQLLRFAWQVADGMSFLSSNKIVHRDLAARNVLVGERENCKVTDFGMARDVHQDDIYQKTSRGRLPVKWTAFEALMYGTYTTKSDVWSYGVVLFELFTVGGCPYPKKDGRKIAELLQLGYRMPKPVHVDDELYQIMMNCWQQNPDSRPSFKFLRENLKEMEKTHERLINMKKYDKKLYENVDDLFA